MAASSCPTLGEFASEETDPSARDLWAKRLGLIQGTLKLPKEKILGGGVLPHAPPLPKLGSPEDPGRIIKDWEYYKFRPYNADLTCAFNKYGPDFRWPGLNSTPVRQLLTTHHSHPGCAAEGRAPILARHRRSVEHWQSWSVRLPNTLFPTSIGRGCQSLSWGQHMILSTTRRWPLRLRSESESNSFT